jgi:predicted transcriptional regulator
MAENFDRVSSIRLTAQIIEAYLSNNTVPSAEIPALIRTYLKIPDCCRSAINEE